MKRDRIQLYLIVLLAGGLLAGCTAGTVEDVVPEESRPVELRFSKPDLGTPVLLSRAGEEATVPATSATPLPEGATVRIYGYLRGEVGLTGSLVNWQKKTECPVNMMKLK